MIGSVDSWQIIADDLPPMLEGPARVHDRMQIVAAGFRTLGYPASWIDTPEELRTILTELEK